MRLGHYSACSAPSHSSHQLEELASLVQLVHSRPDQATVVEILKHVSVAERSDLTHRADVSGGLSLRQTPTSLLPAHLH